MDLIVAKILSSLIFFSVTVVFGLVPYCCFRWCFYQRGHAERKRRGNRQVLIVQCLSSMSSGVLIATCLLHLLPESLEAVKEAIASKCVHNRPDMKLANSTLGHMTNSSDCNDQLGEDQYPVAEFLVALGFLCVYVVESGIKSCSTGEDNASHSACDANEEGVFLGTIHTYSKQTANEQSYASASNKEPGKTTGHWWRNHFQFKLRLLKSKISVSPHTYEPVLETDREFELEDNASSENSATNYSLLDQNVHQQYSDSGMDIKTSLTHPSSCPHAGRQKPSKCCVPNQLRSVALVSALCIHGFFDGVMLGLQTSVSVVLSLLIAIALHKSFVSVGLSLNLLKNNDKNASLTLVILSVLLFAVAAPLGMLVSAVFLHETFDLSLKDEVSVVPGCLQSFAVGTFMYVAFTETTQSQHKRTLSVDLVSSVFLFAGFALMAGLRAVVGSS